MYGDLLHGLGITLGMAALGFAAALILGTLLALLRISPVLPLRALATCYVTVFRSVPLLVLLVVSVFGLPYLGLLYPLFATATGTMALYWAAFVCEVVRSGVNTVPVGQAEAARALGLTFGQCLRHVILPQSLRPVVQPLANILIGLTLSTSLAAAVGVSELTGQSELLSVRSGDPLPVFVAVGAAYGTLTLICGLTAGRIERRLASTR